jgi:hypothetical protein
MNFEENLIAFTRRAAGLKAVQRGLVLASLFSLPFVATAASAQAVNFYSVNVCPSGKTTPSPCNKNETVTFNIPAGTTIGSIAIVTTGIADLDFKAKADDTSATLCKAQTYSSATTCTVDVTFAPLAPGARNGAVELLDASSKVIAMNYVYGVGTSPEIGFNPAAHFFLGNSQVIETSGSIAVDAAGNIFVANGNPDVLEVVAAGGYLTTKTIPTGVASELLALDGAGNLFVVYTQNLGGVVNTGVEELLAADNYATIKIFNSHLFQSYIYGMTVDSSGNVFVTTYYPTHGTVEEISAAGGYNTSKTLVASGFGLPDGIAVDSAGNLFVTDEGLNSVVEIPKAGGYSSVKTVAGNIHVGHAIALDAASNIFVNLSNGDFGVRELVAAGGYTTVNPLDFSATFALAADGSGNVYAAGDRTSIDELSRSQPPALAFDNATVGEKSSDSPQSVTAQNIGNTTLTFSGLSSTDEADFPLVAGPGTPPDCTPASSLASSVECNLSVEFTPQSPGNLTSSLVLTNNSGNATAATQSIDLSGRGLSAETQVSPASLQFGSVAYPGSATKPLTITNIGTGTLTVNPVSNGPSVFISASTCGAGITAGKSCTLQVEFKPATLGSHTNTLTLQTNIGVSPTVPTSGTATGVGVLKPSLSFYVEGRGNTEVLPLTVTNYGVPGSVTVATETGAVQFSVVSNGCLSGITAGNSCIIQVEYAPVEKGYTFGNLTLIPSTGPKQVVQMDGDLLPEY